MRAQILWSLPLLGVLVMGCAPPTSPANERDIALYMQRLSEWAPQEAEVARAVRRILETEFVDEAEVRRQVTESLPRLEAQLVLMRAYHPRSDALQRVHGAYVEAWAGLRQGYADITAGLDTGDQTALGRGRGALLAWRQALPETAKRLRALTEAKTEQGPPT